MRAALLRASAFALLIPCADAGAQSTSASSASSASNTPNLLPAGVALGDPVRVWSPELGRRSGRPAVLAGWTTDSLSLLPPDRWRRMETRLEPVPGAPPYAVSLPSITRVEVRVARKRGETAWEVGLAMAGGGAISGALIGGLLDGMGAENGLEFGIGVGAGVGLAMGALMGAAVPGGYWRRVPLSN